MAKIIGTTASETLTGTGAIDAIYGLSGDDALLAGAGGDFVNGGDGRDTIFGGAGDDALYGHSPDLKAGQVSTINAIEVASNLFTPLLALAAPGDPTGLYIAEKTAAALSNWILRPAQNRHFSISPTPS